MGDVIQSVPSATPAEKLPGYTGTTTAAHRPSIHRLSLGRAGLRGRDGRRRGRRSATAGSAAAPSHQGAARRAVLAMHYR